MRLKFQFSEYITIDRKTLIDTIIFYLKEDDYYIKSYTDSVVAFTSSGDPFRIVSRNHFINKMDNGNFEINHADKIITLTFYINPLAEIIFVFVAILLSFFLTYLFGIFAAILIIQFVVRINNIKKSSQQMLYEIATS